MATVYLGHTFVAVHDNDTELDEQTITGVTHAEESTIKKVGDHSCKLTIATSSGSGIMASDVINPAVDLSAKTHVTFWFRSDKAVTANEYKFQISESANLATPAESIAFPSEALSANKWYRICLPFAAATTTRNATISVGLYRDVEVDVETIVYIDDILAFAGLTLNALGCRGLDDPDEVSYWPGQSFELLDGSSLENFVAHRRIITVGCGVLGTKADRVFLHTFFQKTDKWVWYNFDECSVVNADSSGLANTWLNDVEFGRSFTLKFKEKQARTTDTESWT